MIKFKADKTENIAKQIARHSGLVFGVIQKKLRGKEVQVNGVRVNGGTVEEGSEIIVFAQEKKFEPKVIFEDERVLVVDKPRGVESEEFAGKLNCYAVHRLDRNTCGVLMMAKTKRIKENLMQAMNAEKTYIAKVFGQPKFDGRSYAVWLQKRSEESFVKVYAKETPNSVKAETWFKTLKTGSVMSLVECRLRAGKTHQVRVHLAFLGFPVVGDEKYGLSERNKVFKAKYQELYAVKIETHIKGEFAYLNDVKLECNYEINV